MGKRKQENGRKGGKERGGGIDLIFFLFFLKQWSVKCQEKSLCSFVCLSLIDYHLRPRRGPAHSPPTHTYTHTHTHTDSLHKAMSRQLCADVQCWVLTVCA